MTPADSIEEGQEKDLEQAEKLEASQQSQQNAHPGSCTQEHLT